MRRRSTPAAGQAADEVEMVSRAAIAKGVGASVGSSQEAMRHSGGRELEPADLRKYVSHLVLLKPPPLRVENLKRTVVARRVAGRAARGR